MNANWLEADGSDESVGAPLAGSVREQIREEAKRVGFDAVGFTAIASSPADARNLDLFLAQGRHGEMTWMESTADRRRDLTRLWPEARSAIVCAMNYRPDADPRTVLSRPDEAAISVYARGRDYHDVMRKALKRLGRWITQTFHCDIKVFVDTPPIMEKPLAMRAGLGWIGKHTNLVSRRFGSWLFLSEILTDLSIPADAPETNHCGSCDACVQACPTNALAEPYRIDPRRCLSYLTIESRSAIPADLATALGNRIYGCDDCLAACPWSKFAPKCEHPEFVGSSPATIRLHEIAQWSEDDFRRRFSGTAVKRSGLARIRRNGAIALANGRNA